MPDTGNITKNLLEMYGRDDWVMRYNFRKFISRSGLGALSKDAKIVDCGCGMGHFLAMLRTSGFSNLTGIDASEEMVTRAREMTGDEIILCDAVDIADHLVPGSHDAVIISDLLHHVPDVSGWCKLLSGCNEVLKPGGLLVIREPFPNFGFNLLWKMSRYKFLYVGFLKSRLQSFKEEDHLVRFFFEHWPAKYKELLEKHGFEIIVDANWTVHRITTSIKAEVST